MKIVKDQITISELQDMAKKMHGEFVKAIIDVQKGIMAVDAPLHSDLLELLVAEENAEPENLWGINIHSDKKGDDFVEFDSMMNIKPGLGNLSRYVKDEKIREKILKITNKLIIL